MKSLTGFSFMLVKWNSHNIWWGTMCHFLLIKRLKNKCWSAATVLRGKCYWRSKATTWGNRVQGSWKLPKLFVSLKWCHYQIWLVDNQHCLCLVSKFHTRCFEQLHRKTIVFWFPFLLYVHKCMYQTAGMLPASQEPGHVLFLPDSKQRFPSLITLSKAEQRCEHPSTSYSNF